MPRSDSEILNEQYPEDTVSGIALASAARTTTTSSADFTRPPGVRGVRVWINETAHASSPSVVFTIEVKSPISGVYTAVLTSAAITGEGNTMLTLLPGVTVAANVAISNGLSKTWKVKATHGNADSCTYSVAFEYLY